MENVKLIEFKDIIDGENETRPRGHLTPVEGNVDIPFEIKRIYYLSKVPENTTRGFHSHQDLEQVLICLNGSVKISVSTPFENKIYELNNPAEGLFIGPMIWREMYDFSPGSVLLVLASKLYDEKDYIRDYKKYCSLAYEFFNKGVEE